MVRRVQVRGQSQIEVARELGIAPNTLSRWMRPFRDEQAESFFATLECELLDRQRFKNRREARMAVFDFIEGFYNPVAEALCAGDEVAGRLREEE